MEICSKHKIPFAKRLFLAGIQSSSVIDTEIFCPACNAERDTYNNDFQILLDHFCTSYRAFCLNKYLHEWLRDIYEKNRLAWDVVLTALEEKYLLGLAKTLIKPCMYQEKTISIYEFSDKGVQDPESILPVINDWRNKIGGHIDKEINRGEKSILVNVGISRKNIDQLFELAIKDISQIALEKFSNNMFDKFLKDKNDMEAIGKTWLNSFSNVE